MKARPEGVEPPTFWSVVRRSIQLSYGRLAEREGFEPSRGLSSPTRLAGERFRPLSHLSKLAEGVGFEPTVWNTYISFQD